MPEIAPTISELLSSRRYAFLLSQLAGSAEGKLLQSDANSAIPSQFKKELQLGPKFANALRHEMASLGWAVEEKDGRNAAYSITETGRRKLHDLERYIPLLPAKGSVIPAADDRELIAREAYVLDALSRADAQTVSRAELDAGFGGRPKLKVAELAAKCPAGVAFRDQHCIRLNPATTLGVLSELALHGSVLVNRTAGSEAYTLTALGMERLDRLRSECPVLPPTGGKPMPPANESIRRGREAFLLLKLLEAPKHTAFESEAQTVSYPKPLKLNHATAWQVRGELAREGHVTIHRVNDEGGYTLTPSGKRYLATLSFDAFGEVRIKGAALTELLAAAREAPAPSPEVSRPVTARQSHTAAAERLREVVADAIQELQTGPFAHLRMVPIYALRSAVAERLGASAGSRADFDELLLDLRRTGRLRLISIDDRSRATPEQLRDSVTAVGETFFYAEGTNGFAQGG